MESNAPNSGTQEKDLNSPSIAPRREFRKTKVNGPKTLIKHLKSDIKATKKSRRRQVYDPNTYAKAIMAQRGDSMSKMKERIRKSPKNKHYFKKIKLLINTSISKFFLYSKKINFESKLDENQIIINLKLFVFGVLHVIEKYPLDKWKEPFFNMKVNMTHALMQIYQYSTSYLFLLTNGNHFKLELLEYTAIVEELLDIERLLLICFKKLFSTYHSLNFIEQSPGIIYYFVASLNSVSPTNQLEALLIVKSLLREMNLHHRVLSAIKRYANFMKFKDRIDCFAQLMERDSNETIRKHLIITLKRIYFSNSQSPLLNKFIEEIEKSKYEAQFHDEKSQRDLINQGEAYWKNQFFYVSNRLDDSKDWVVKINDLVNQVDNLLNEKKTLEHKNHELLENVATLESRFEEVRHKIAPLKAVFMLQQNYNEEELLEKLLTESLKVIEEINHLTDIKPASEGKDEDYKSDSGITSRAQRDSREKFIGSEVASSAEAEEKEDDDEISGFDVLKDDITDIPPPPPPPPIFDPPPLLDPAEQAALALKKLNADYEDLIHEEIRQSLIERNEKDGIFKKLPFLNFNDSKGVVSNKSTCFDNVSKKEFEIDHLEEYISQFSREQKPDNTQIDVKKVEKIRTTNLPENIIRKIAIGLKKLKLDEDELFESIKNFNTEFFTQETLEILLLITPTFEEFNILVKSEKDNRITDKNERFVYRIWSIPHCRSFLKFVNFHMNYDELISSITTRIDKLNSGCKHILEDNPLDGIFKSALFLGNITNFSKSKSSLKAYSFENFGMLLDTKASNGKETLMKYILKIKFNSPKNLNAFNELQKTLNSLLTVSIGTLKVDIDAFWKEVENTETIIMANTSMEKYKDFYVNSVNEISVNDEIHSEINGMIFKIRSYYCLDQMTGTERLFEIFKNLSDKVLHALPSLIVPTNQ